MKEIKKGIFRLYFFDIVIQKYKKKENILYFIFFYHREVIT